MMMNDRSTKWIKRESTNRGTGRKGDVEIKNRRRSMAKDQGLRSDQKKRKEEEEGRKEEEERKGKQGRGREREGDEIRGQEDKRTRGQEDKRRIFFLLVFDSKSQNERRGEEKRSTERGTGGRRRTTKHPTVQAHSP